jgi:hypothetical protein
MKQSIIKSFQKLVKQGPRLRKWGSKALNFVLRNKAPIAKVSVFGAAGVCIKSIGTKALDLAKSPWTIAILAIIALYLILNLILKIKNRHA